ncbi:MAG: hypothetical protein K6C13_05410 [Oscillospiraceae bacterium]|nr:hypothetical protein [Oscillospiraceae bacterium]
MLKPFTDRIRVPNAMPAITIDAQAPVISDAPCLEAVADIPTITNNTIMRTESIIVMI